MCIRDRLKPVNIYYHIYAVSKQASLKALQEAYEWALAQQLYPVRTSSYAARARDFFRTTIARQDNGWLIRNAGDLRQIRVPKEAGYPDLETSRGVLGFSDHNDQRYIHLAPGGESFLKLTASAETDAQFSFGNSAGCRIRSGDRDLPSKSEGTVLSTSIPPGSHGLELDCK